MNKKTKYFDKDTSEVKIMYKLFKQLTRSNFSENKYKKGFSMMEILVVLSILGVLMGVVLPKAGSTMDAARDVSLKSIVKSLQLACESHMLINGNYPEGSSLSVIELSQALINSGQLSEMPINPYTGKPFSADDISGSIRYSSDSINGYSLVGFGKNLEKELIKVETQ